MSEIINKYNLWRPQRYSDIRVGDTIIVKEILDPNKRAYNVEEGNAYKVMMVRNHSFTSCTDASCIHNKIDIEIIGEDGSQTATCLMVIANKYGVNYIKE